MAVARQEASARCPRRAQNEERVASPKSTMTVMEEIGVVGLGCGRWEQRGIKKRVMSSKNATLTNSSNQLVKLGSKTERERYHRSAQTASISFRIGTNADIWKIYNGCPCCPTSIVIIDSNDVRCSTWTEGRGSGCTPCPSSQSTADKTSLHPRTLPC